MNFVAIDFGTANSNRHSVCEIRISVVKNMQVVENMSMLIKPKDNYFDSYNTYSHGIDADMVANEPEFYEVWDSIKHYFTGKLIAHNASFDFSVLRHVLDLYEIEYPEFDYSCTYQIAKKEWTGLFSYDVDSVREHLGVDFKHHKANSCAEIAIKAFSNHNIENFSELEDAFSLKIGKIYKGGYSPAITKRKRKYTKISDIEYDETKFDENNVFFGANVVFTGKLNNLLRKEAQQKVMEIGGNCTAGITKQTNYLILGDQDYEKYGEGFKSSKIKKAEKLLSEGQDIELLSEIQFIELIS